MTETRGVSNMATEHNYVTDVQLTPTAARFYNEDSGLEVVIARHHLVQVCWDGTTLTVASTLVSGRGAVTWQFVEHPDYARNDPDSPRERLDRFVSAFVCGGES